MTKPRALPTTSWSENDIATMRSLVDRGWTASRIAGYIGREPSAVQTWLRRQGLYEHRRRMRESIKAAMLAMPDLNNRQLAELLGCSADLVGDVRGPRHAQTRVERFATSIVWLDQPPGRVKALRQAEGIDP